MCSSAWLTHETRPGLKHGARAMPLTLAGALAIVVRLPPELRFAVVSRSGDATRSAAERTIGVVHVTAIVFFAPLFSVSTNQWLARKRLIAVCMPALTAGDRAMKLCFDDQAMGLCRAGGARLKCLAYATFCAWEPALEATLHYISAHDRALQVRSGTRGRGGGISPSKHLMGRH